MNAHPRRTPSSVVRAVRPPQRPLAALVLAVAATSMAASACSADPPDRAEVIEMLTDDSRPADERMTEEQANCVWDSLRLDNDALLTLSEERPDSEARSRATSTIEMCMGTEKTATDET